MSQIYYHVVTDKPIKVGQELILDESHHSGVYDRVYSLKEKVDDIYKNPNKYKNIELDHHLKVALRELAMEEVRKEKYPEFPSRLASLYVSNTLDEALKWYNLFIELGRPTYSIVKVLVDGNIYIGDAENCFDGTVDKNKNLELAENYWKYKENPKGKEPIVEILANGKIKVIEIVKENNMENILVTSGGFNTINNYVSDENIELFKKIANGKKVLIIANAAPRESGNYVARENVKENFLNVGATKADIVDLNSDNINIMLEYDVIYGLGGNVTHLIELNNTTSFKETLIKFLEKGIYIGESAGSMILADDIKYIYDIKKGTKPKYDVILDSYKGLGLIDIYVFPHFQRENEIIHEKTSSYEANNNIKITRLNDGEILKYSYKNRL
jgi:peptidase E